MSFRPRLAGQGSAFRPGTADSSLSRKRDASEMTGLQDSVFLTTQAAGFAPEVTKVTCSIRKHLPIIKDAIPLPI